MTTKWNKEMVLRCVHEDKLPSELEGSQNPLDAGKNLIENVIQRIKGGNGSKEQK